MNRNHLILLLFLVSAQFVGGLAWAAQPPLLTLGEPVERTLAIGERHEFRVTLEENQYLLLVVDQRDIDVVVRFYGPDGEHLNPWAENSRTGVESLSFFSKVEGDYGIEIASFDEEAEPGEYAVEIIRLETAGRTPSNKIDQLLALVDRRDSPGASVAVIRDGEIIYKKGFGSAQLEYEIPITPSTIFHVASVSKQFTAFAVALLADQGKLSLDDDVRKHIPEVPDFGKTITLRHLIESPDIKVGRSQRTGSTCAVSPAHLSSSNNHRLNTLRRLLAAAEQAPQPERGLRRRPSTEARKYCSGRSQKNP